MFQKVASQSEEIKAQGKHNIPTVSNFLKRNASPNKQKINEQQTPKTNRASYFVRKARSNDRQIQVDTNSSKASE